jgi:D-amino-acid dehydrogenase
VVLGAGIVGLCCAYHLMQRGHAVTILDRDPAGDKTSFGNAGGIAVTENVPMAAPGLLWKVPLWLLDPLGPVALRPAHLPRLLPWLAHLVRSGTRAEMARIGAALAALNGRVYDDLVPMLAQMEAGAELRRTGALAVYESAAGLARDREAWAMRRAHGIVCEAMDGDAARQLEPALSAKIRHAVLMPQWSNVSDPKRIVDLLRKHLVERGAVLVAGEATAIDGNNVRTADGRDVPFGVAVVALGAWSGELAARMGERVLLESERGYATTIAAPGIAVQRQIIFAERQFVASPLSIGLRIGGAAEFAGLTAEANFARAETLVRLAKRYLPALQSAGGTAWMGNRPATPDGLPVISRSARRQNVFHAFGHGHLGLTQSASTGRLIAELVDGMPTSIDLAPFGIERFATRSRVGEWTNDLVTENLTGWRHQKIYPQNTQRGYWPQRKAAFSATDLDG